MSTDFIVNVTALRDSIEIYAWAPKPYHKFMAFKSFSGMNILPYGISSDLPHFLSLTLKTHGYSATPELQHKPVLVDLTVEEGTRLKVLYGSSSGFHAVDLDSASVYDIYLPKHAQVWEESQIEISEVLDRSRFF